MAIASAGCGETESPERAGSGLSAARGVATPTVSSLRAAAERQRMAFVSRNFQQYCESFDDSVLTERYGSSDPLSKCVDEYEHVRIVPSQVVEIGGVRIKSPTPTCGVVRQLLPANSAPGSPRPEQATSWTIIGGTWKQVAACPQ
jgi:hypothetical protein